MTTNAKRSFLLILAAVLMTNAVAEKKKPIPVAPLPEAIVAAKTVFISNAGGSDEVYDAFYAVMKNWNRFVLVGSPDKADLLFQISYIVEDKGTKVLSNTDTYTGQTHVYSVKKIDPQLILSIFDAKSKDSLWQTSVHRKLAMMEHNRDKNTIKAAQELADGLRFRLETPQ
jgi:hypothetical protein